MDYNLQTTPAIIVITSTEDDGYVLITHADYFLSFNIHGVLTQAYQDIKNNKYKNMKIIQLKQDKNTYVYNYLMEKYNTQRPTNIKFTNYYGKNAIDFIPITITEFNDFVKI